MTVAPSFPPLNKWDWSVRTQWENIHYLLKSNWSPVRNITIITFPFFTSHSNRRKPPFQQLSTGIIGFVVFFPYPSGPLWCLQAHVGKACRKHATRKICPETASKHKTAFRFRLLHHSPCLKLLELVFLTWVWQIFVSDWCFCCHSYSIPTDFTIIVSISVVILNVGNHRDTPSALEVTFQLHFKFLPPCLKRTTRSIMVYISTLAWNTNTGKNGWMK